MLIFFDCIFFNFSKKMEKKMQSKIYRTIIEMFLAIGFALCLGSIASFIAMNAISGKIPNIEISYWQRTFVNPIMKYVTIPGIWIFLFSNFLIFITRNDKKNKANISLLILSVLIFINGQFVIVPIAEIVNNLAIQQFNSKIVLEGYLSKKTIEDICGGINLILFLSYLGLYVKNELDLRS